MAEPLDDLLAALRRARHHREIDMSMHDAAIALWVLQGAGAGATVEQLAEASGLPAAKVERLLTAGPDEI